MSTDDRDSTSVRIPNDIKQKLDTIKDDRGCRSYGATIKQLMKENEQLRQENENYRKIMNKIPDAE